MSKQAKKLAFDQFAVKVIRATLARKGKTKTGKEIKGINVKTDGFNELARKYYGNEFDVVAAVNKLIEDKILEGHPVKGGFKVYIYGEKPNSKGFSVEDIAQDIGLEL